MDKQETVDSWQMATLFLAFMTGSAIVNIPAPLTAAAGNGAWLSLIIANGAGMLLLACILYLRRRYPGMTMIDYSRKVLGNGMTVLLAFPFVLTVILMFSYIVLDIGGFFASSLLIQTPSYAVHSLIILTAALTARAGIEAMARMFILLLYSMYFFIFLVLMLVQPYFHPEYLLPAFPQGMKPVIHGAYIAFGFPYAELILFAMVLPFVRKSDDNRLGKYMFSALLVNGLSLILVVICSIMVKGPLASELKFSVFQLARLITVQDVIERVESIVGISLIVGSYMKATITLFVVNLALSQLLKLQDNRILMFPLALVSLLLTLVMFDYEAEFTEKVTAVWPLITAVAFVFPILLITLVTVIKGKGGNGP
ncbi:endospore germination permease [Paenibacillus alkaliterrae]|uniref:GerAB/ArcD/ProY family transporter n=1 Tax=Paenibacillus alkaliterrae TaxID=320909 RepID=UPI001F254E72|nr:endospore germination permease [Paenibacillus alkaliterrae]MCF2937954.1 endospore germination permease [Paenibacillus alkaliterrae]